MPFKSKKQKTYLAINEPDVYKKFKKEEQNMYGKPMKKKMYGGKVQEIAKIDELFNNPVHPYTIALLDSIPKLEIQEKRLKALRGMVPSILELGDGCKLCSRFDPKDCACGGTGNEPQLIEFKNNHFVRCNPDIL